jgi:hypothetical protein
MAESSSFTAFSVRVAPVKLLDGGRRVDAEAGRGFGTGGWMTKPAMEPRVAMVAGMTVRDI